MAHLLSVQTSLHLVCNTSPISKVSCCGCDVIHLESVTSWNRGCGQFHKRPWMISGQLAALFPISVGAYQPDSTVTHFWPLEFAVCVIQNSLSISTHQPMKLHLPCWRQRWAQFNHHMFQQHLITTCEVGQSKYYWRQKEQQTTNKLYVHILCVYQFQVQLSYPSAHSLTVTICFHRSGDTSFAVSMKESTSNSKDGFLSDVKGGQPGQRVVKTGMRS